MPERPSRAPFESESPFFACYNSARNPMNPPLPQAQRWSGPHLYKYGSKVDWLEDLILHHRLYIPTVSQMNDPNDSRPRLRKLDRRELARFLVANNIKKHPELAAARPEFIALVQQLLTGMDTDELFRWAVLRVDEDLAARRVYSMSVRWDNTKMWAQYANGHRGYCLEFLNDADDRLFGMARQVIYDDSYEMDLIDDGHISPVWYVFKHPDWRSEEEVRIVLPRKLGGPVFDIPPHILTRVILGKDVSPADNERIRVWASARTPPLPVAITTYDQFTRSFALDG
jgi:hypothetical protein